MISMRWTARVILLLLAVPGFNNPEAQDPRISEWVENAPASDPDRIALGYPVPIPVDTPLPFDGFRSYSGLHARHQDLSNTTPWVTAFDLGETRAGRTIWAYQLGDENHVTKYGLAEHAMLTNGGIHAREWQSHEVATGIMELMALDPDDDHLVTYLRDNANVLVIPVLNIDGFLQTQRFPDTNWIGTDLNDPEESPRDGRMRRKNMLGADEVLATQGDHLLGVDLNRNNPPYWATDPESSSDLPESLVHHGSAPQSEPEIQALAAAAMLGPAEKLSMYTDLHSYSQVHFWDRNENEQLTQLTERLLATFTNHHFAFDAGKYYWFEEAENIPINEGIGTTNDYFLQTYQVPAWTLEIEPTYGLHPELPGQGADYGGLGRNGHDGFILPESEVERVRTEVAQSMAVAYYQQSGPPSLAAVRLIDEATGAVVIESEWDVSGETSRELYSFQAQPLQFDRTYIFWVAFDKPMRWREDGEVVALPGQPGSTLDFDASLQVAGTELSVQPVGGQWLDEAGDAPDGYLRYRDDALAISFDLPADEHNLGLVDGTVTGTMGVETMDMTGNLTDADPSTVARWEEGKWSGYEDDAGVDQGVDGGMDRTIQFEITSDTLPEPFVVEPPSSAMWYDTSRNGEGFMLEIISPTRAILYWFTYDTQGRQDWYFADGEIRGNRALFPDVLRVSGGEFGPGFDPEKVIRTPIGHATFIWTSCDSGEMKYVFDRDESGYRQGRMSVSRLTRVMGMPCTEDPQPPVLEAERLSGSWYDPSHSGEGITIEVMTNQQVLLFWFSYDTEGNRRWFFGTGDFLNEKIVFNEMFTTLGGVFGPEFDPEAVDVNPWGTLELELDCTQGTMRFDPIEEGFPAGMLDMSRLTLLDGLSCED